MARASLSEIFASIQGEGADAGRQALFIRFGGCNLSCSYCDTQYARQRAKSFSVDLGGSETEVDNPARTGEILGIVYDRCEVPETAVITGGEPLLQAEAVRDLAENLRMKGCRIHLETNGTLPDAFGAVRHLVDTVSVDVKIPSLVEGRSYESEHVEFLELAGGTEAYVKVVLDESVSDHEVDGAIALVARVNPFLPVFLQPVFAGSQMGISMEKLVRLHARAARALHDVRISVQLHKIMNIR